MNTRKQVLIMTTLLLMMLVLVAAYGAWYPSRAKDSEAHFEDATSERGAILFAHNCRLCHGDVGEGGALAGRLAQAPTLNTPRLQGFVATKATLTDGSNAAVTTLKLTANDGLKAGDVILVDAERMEVSEVNDNVLTVERGIEHTDAAQHFANAAVWKFDKAQSDHLNPQSILNVITNTISCGRVGTPMPIWGQKNGGSLSDEQIRQLQTLIMEGRWDLVKEENDIEDKVATHLTQAMDASTISMFVNDVSVFTKDTYIRIGDERIHLKDVPELDKNLKGELPKDRSGVIGVERGVLGTTPLEHSADSVLYNYAVPAAPSITSYSCGQTAQAPAPAGTPELIENFTGQTVEVSAFGVKYNLSEIKVNSGGQVRIRFTNKDAGTKHNIAFYKSAADVTAVSTGSVGLVFDGTAAGATDDTVFDVPAKGSYIFRCDIHPAIMTGTFTVQ